MLHIATIYVMFWGGEMCLSKIGKTNFGEWGPILKESMYTIFDAIKKIEIFSFFIVSVCFVGGAGVWLPWITDTNPQFLRGDNIFTYGVAILGGLLCDKLLFSKDTNNRKFKGAGILLGTISLVLISIAYSKSRTESSYVALFGLLMALCIHLIVIASDKKRWEEDIKVNLPPTDDEVDAVMGSSMAEPPSPDILTNGD